MIKESQIMLWHVRSSHHGNNKNNKKEKGESQDIFQTDTETIQLPVKQTEKFK